MANMRANHGDGTLLCRTQHPGGLSFCSQIYGTRPLKFKGPRVAFFEWPLGGLQFSRTIARQVIEMLYGAQPYRIFGQKCRGTLKALESLGFGSAFVVLAGATLL